MVKNPLADAGDAGFVPGSARPPEKEMATHSSILAWEIPWTEEPGGLQSMGLQRAGHDLATKLTIRSLYTCVSFPNHSLYIFNMYNFY